MGWLITLAVLLILAALPLGVKIRYDADGAVVKIIAGLIRVTVIPAPKKEKKEKKNPKDKTKTRTEDENLPKPPQPPKTSGGAKEKTGDQKGGSLTDFLPLVKVALDLLGDLRRKLRLDDLYLRLILAADDPCDLAVNYGRAWAALGNLLPSLEKWFVIKKRDLEVECDFTASKTLVIARLDLTITLGRLVAMVVKYGVRALMEFLKIKKKRKGGAVK